MNRSAYGRYTRAGALALLALTGAIAPGTTWAYKSCLANVNHSIAEIDVSRNHSTWVPLDEASRADAAGRLRAVLTAMGATRLRERVAGAQHILAARLPRDNWDTVDVEFTVDPEVGAVSVVAHVPDRSNASLEFQPVVCALLETAFRTGEELPQNDSMFASKRQKAAQAWEDALDLQFRADLDGLYARALAAGRALVVMPTVNLDARYEGRAQQVPVDFWADLTSSTRWHRADGGPSLAVGNTAGHEFDGLNGFHHSMVARKLRYLVYIVQPGRYEFDGMAVDVKDAKLPALQSDGKVAGVGTVDFAPGKYTAYYHDQEWRDASYADRTVKSNYCSLTIVGGPCVQWSTQTSVVQEMTRQAGYQDVTKSYAADMLQVALHVDRPFASFEAKAGEVLIVDGLYAQHPSVGFDTTSCSITAEGARCPATDVAMVRLVADAADVDSEGFAKGTANFPALREALRRAVYRPLTFTAKSGALVPALGQVYTLAK